MKSDASLLQDELKAILGDQHRYNQGISRANNLTNISVNLGREKNKFFTHQVSVNTRHSVNLMNKATQETEIDNRNSLTVTSPTTFKK